jgi:hypothetical protein
MVVRRTAAVTFALVGLAGAFIAGTGAAADATDGQAVFAGQSNSESHETHIYNTQIYTDATCASTGQTMGGLLSCGGIGLTGRGTNFGIHAIADSGAFAGILAEGPIGALGEGPTGVSGIGTENGVKAEGGTFGVFASGDDYGVYASAPNHGVYGTATTNAGAGVEAQANSASGIALRVNGKAQFSRSGTATVAGTTTTPKSSVVISNVALSGKSLVLATAQKNVAGVWVEAAVPNVSAKTVTIFLNKTVTVSYPVAWFIVEKP